VRRTTEQVATRRSVLSCRVQGLLHALFSDRRVRSITWSPWAMWWPCGSAGRPSKALNPEQAKVVLAAARRGGAQGSPGGAGDRTGSGSKEPAWHRFRVPHPHRCRAGREQRAARLPSVREGGRREGSWTPRELRHSFVSLMSEKGVSLEDIARLVGHSSTNTTELVHRKELPPVVTERADVMGELFSEWASATLWRPCSPRRTAPASRGRRWPGWARRDSNPWPIAC